jgi:hypothetical protein
MPQLPEYRVIVVRAWRDAGGLRVRLLSDGDPGAQWVVGSVAEACSLLGSLLSELLDADPGAPVARR